MENPIKSEGDTTNPTQTNVSQPSPNIEKTNILKAFGQRRKQFQDNLDRIDIGTLRSLKTAAMWGFAGSLFIFGYFWKNGFLLKLSMVVGIAAMVFLFVLEQMKEEQQPPPAAPAPIPLPPPPKTI